MITAIGNDALAYICRKVDALKPNECLTVDRYFLNDIPSFFHNDARFSPADRVLENIVGSAYTHSYTVNHMNGDVTFRRHEDTGQRRYSSPDRR